MMEILHNAKVEGGLFGRPTTSIKGKEKLIPESDEDAVPVSTLFDTTLNFILDEFRSRR